MLEQNSVNILVRIIGLVGVMLMVAACSSNAPTTEERLAIIAALPEGNPEDGEMLYNQRVNGAPTCLACHLIVEGRGGGPGLAGYATRAGNTVEGESAELYTYNAIVYPGDYIVPGYSNAMYRGYGEAYTDQQMADMIAYLLTLE